MKRARPRLGVHAYNGASLRQRFRSTLERSRLATQRTLIAIGLAVALTTGTAGSGDAAAAGKCQLARAAEWPVRVERGALLIDGAINGAKVGITLDTGATHTMILRSAALRLNLARRTIRGVGVFGVGGESQLEAAQVDEIKIGDATRKNWQMQVAGEHDFGGAIDVVLGEDFFRRFDVEFDLAAKTVRLFQPMNCENAPLAYWTKEVPHVVDIEPIDDARPQVVLTVQVNGRPVRALLDSGAGASVINKGHAFDAGVSPDTPGVVNAGKAYGVGAKSVDTWIGPFKSVAIGTELIRDTTLAFSDIYRDTTYTPPGSYLPKQVYDLKPMLLGADFLRAHRVLVSHSQRRIYFTYVGGTVFQSAAIAQQRADEPQADGRR
jgi:predicted aspartyl protease